MANSLFQEAVQGALSESGEYQSFELSTIRERMFEETVRPSVTSLARVSFRHRPSQFETQHDHEYVIVRVTASEAILEMAGMSHFDAHRVAFQHGEGISMIHMQSSRLTALQSKFNGLSFQPSAQTFHYAYSTEPVFNPALIERLYPVTHPMFTGSVFEPAKPSTDLFARTIERTGIDHERIAAFGGITGIERLSPDDPRAVNSADYFDRLVQNALQPFSEL